MQHKSKPPPKEPGARAPGGFDWMQPDYRTIYQMRANALKRIRADPDQLPALKAYYREHPAQFIMDWGTTVDPRNLERKLPAVVPFILFPKQIAWVDWVMEGWRGGEGGVCDKSRDMGVTWLAISLACTLCLFNEGMAIGFGSRKEEYVDKLGDPKSIFYKGREFLKHLPREFLDGWDSRTNAPHMRIVFPGTNSTITGESGDNIGRGDRTAIYFVDEAAHLERPLLVEASLSATTNSRVDISTPWGMANPFAQKRHGGNVRTFTLHWRDDPRKDQAWYEKQKKRIDNPVVVAQELDLDYAASVEGVLIPSAWVEAAIDADAKLGILLTGLRGSALDVADQGQDSNAWCMSRGVRVEQIEEWSGKGSDILESVHRAMLLCDEHGCGVLTYDGDGLGAGVKGDARRINEDRAARRQPQVKIDMFKGSQSPLDPEKSDLPGRQNKDLYSNLKAQGWWRLRERFQATYRAVVEGEDIDPDSLVCLAPDLHLLNKLRIELSQPTWSLNGAGKIVIDKVPDGARSPNLADALMIRLARSPRGMVISGSIRQRFAGTPGTWGRGLSLAAKPVEPVQPDIPPVIKPAGVLGPRRSGATMINPALLARFKR